MSGCFFLNTMYKITVFIFLQILSPQLSAADSIDAAEDDVRAALIELPLNSNCLRHNITDDLKDNVFSVNVICKVTAKSYKRNVI